MNCSMFIYVKLIKCLYTIYCFKKICNLEKPLMEKKKKKMSYNHSYVINNLGSTFVKSISIQKGFYLQQYNNSTFVK